MASRIRTATLDDLDDLEELENAVFSSDELSRRSLRYYIKAPNAVFLLIESGDMIAGDALVSFRRSSKIGRLYSIAVRRDQAGRGYGRKLLGACEQAVRQRDCTALRLEVRSDNASAISLYERAGYVRFGVYPDYYEDGSSAFRFEKSVARLGSHAMAARPRHSR